MTLWREIQRTGGLDYASRVRMQPAFAHSDAVVAVDERGNVAALCHSINTDAWGSIGLFVDGVSIPDSACFQQHEIAQAGPGERLPDVMNPLIVLRGNRPVLASACVGSALHEVTIQSLLNVLDFRMPVDIAADAPMFYTHAPTTLDRWLGSAGRLERVRGALYQLILSGASIAGRPRAVINPPQAVASNAFPARLLNEVRAMGQTVTEDDDGTIRRLDRHRHRTQRRRGARRRHAGTAARGTRRRSLIVGPNGLAAGQSISSALPPARRDTWTCDARRWTAPCIGRRFREARHVTAPGERSVQG